jgi:protein O-GlcNAc transferase
LYASQADFDRAADAYVKRIDANPNNADGHRRLGEIFFLQGRDEEALGAFTAAQLVDPKNAAAFSGAGQVHARNGRFAEAAAAARDAIALEPRMKDAHFTLGTSLLRLGQSDEGRKELDLFRQLEAEVLAATRRQTDLDALTHEADRHLAANDFAGAVGPLQGALALDPGAARLNRDLGVALLKTGRPGDGIAALEKAVQLADDAAAHRALADAYAAAGRDADSRAQAALAARAADQAKAARLRRLTAR